MYGYEIVQTLIVDIEPDEHVKRAMNEINAGKFHILVVLFRIKCMLTFCEASQYILMFEKLAF